MTTASFKVGDRVKVTDPSGSELRANGTRVAKLGDVATVEKVDRGLLYVRTDDGRKFGMLAYRFTTAPGFNVGDKVELKYGPSSLWNGAATVTAVATLGGRPIVSLKMETGKLPGAIGAFYLDATDTTIAPVADKKAEARAELKAAALELAKVSDALFELELKISRLTDALS